MLQATSQAGNLPEITLDNERLKFYICKPMSHSLKPRGCRARAWHKQGSPRRVKIWSVIVRRAEAAGTGQPICASTTAVHAARSSVLLPAPTEDHGLTPLMQTACHTLTTSAAIKKGTRALNVHCVKGK